MLREPGDAASVDVKSTAAGGGADASRTGIEDEEAHGVVGARVTPHPLHSDGVVCRCAVSWRREAIRRGLARPGGTDRPTPCR